MTINKIPFTAVSILNDTNNNDDNLLEHIFDLFLFFLYYICILLNKGFQNKIELYLLSRIDLIFIIIFERNVFDLIQKNNNEKISYLCIFR